jgi:hypothetical protein
MELFILLILFAVIAGLLLHSTRKKDSTPEPIQEVKPEPTVTEVAPEPKVEEKIVSVLDVNKDNTINVKDLVEAANKTKRKVKKVADQNKDGKVNVKDVKAAVAKAKTKSKKSTTNKT